MPEAGEQDASGEAAPEAEEQVGGTSGEASAAAPPGKTTKKGRGRQTKKSEAAEAATCEQMTMEPEAGQ
ncbi:MAG: hypothetical protein FJ125_12990 [Deltaproteobacteria bacterium]|nr:hypothetical protein [Deltaproteobacteria bacterium]